MCGGVSVVCAVGCVYVHRCVPGPPCPHRSERPAPGNAGVALGWSSVPGKRPVLSVHRTLKPGEVDLNRLEATGGALQLDRPLSPGDGPLRCPLLC